MRKMIALLKDRIKRYKFLASILYRIYLQNLFAYREARSFIISVLIRSLRRLVVHGDIVSLTVTIDGTRLSYYGKSFYWNPGERDSLLGIAHTGSYEKADIKLMQRFIKPNMIVFDIGANYGLHTILLGEGVGSRGHIYSFEPLKNIYKKLKQNIALNGYVDRVTIERIALSNRGGKAKIYISQGLGSGSASLHKRWLGRNVVQTCALSTIDDYVAKHHIPHVDFIKCDVEGAELLVFQGAKRTLEKFKPILFFEAIDNHTRLFDYKIDQEMNFLKGFSYTFYKVNGTALYKVSSFSNGNYFALTSKHSKDYKP